MQKRRPPLQDAVAVKDRLDSKEALVLDLALTVLEHTRGRWTGDEVLEFVYLLEETGGEAFRLKYSSPELSIVSNRKEAEGED